METETPTEEVEKGPAAPPPEPPKKEDYDPLLAVIATMEPVIKKINSARLTQKLDDLKHAIEEEQKELVYQEYLKSKG